MTWTTATVHRPAIRCWGEECVLYDVDSGDTHLVTASAALVLERLQQSPADAPSLLQSFPALVAPVDDGPPGALLDSILADLQRAELIRWMGL